MRIATVLAVEQLMGRQLVPGSRAIHSKTTLASRLSWSNTLGEPQTLQSVSDDDWLWMQPAHTHIQVA